MGKWGLEEVKNIPGKKSLTGFWSFISNVD
jgi:hypothetical protein